MLLLLILLPCLGALLLPFCKKLRHVVLLTALLVEAGLTIFAVLQPETSLHLLRMTDTLSLDLRMDGISRLFLLISAVGFLLAGIFSLRYLPKHEEGSFYSFFLLSQAGLMGMDLASNLTTMYLFFESITLLSMPLVLHDRSKESTTAALKYLFYSIAGAFLALAAIFFLGRYAATLTFVSGGSLLPEAQEHKTLLLVVTFLGVVGFGAKAGMYPLHGWLPSAHPVAPAPASAVLSGVIAKAGVLAIIRLVFFSVGADFLRGTWVQTALLSLALLTVFVGSMMAYRENVFKKRLAFSTVSQISYALTGLFLLTPEGAMGGLMHVLFHATIKICLFLVAGSFIANTGKHRMEEYHGIGKAMPATLWCYTFASLALIGIPPFSGFVSKWYLAIGALDSGISVFSWLAPVVLLISALLTAGYLLPITIGGFFPSKNVKSYKAKGEGGILMLLPLGILAVLTLALGIASQPLAQWFNQLAASMFGGAL